MLTGLARADRWPELRPRAVTAVLEEARRLADVDVVDCSFSLEDDEELSFDTAAPRRNGATLAVLEAADTVLCVSGADPVALQRSIRALGELRDVLPESSRCWWSTRCGGGRCRAIRGGRSPRRWSGSPAGTSGSSCPADRRATDAALASGRTLAEVAPGPPLRAALRSLAAAVADGHGAGARAGAGCAA